MAREVARTNAAAWRSSCGGLGNVLVEACADDLAAAVAFAAERLGRGVARALKRRVNGGPACRWPAPASSQTASVPTKRNRTHPPSNLRERERGGVSFQLAFGAMNLEGKQEIASPPFLVASPETLCGPCAGRLARAVWPLAVYLV